MKSIFDKDFFTWENLKTTWEVKIITFIVRACFAVGVFLFIALLPYKAWLWAELQWVKNDPLTRLEPLIEESAREGTPEDVTKWLVYRSREDSAALLDRVPPHAASLESIVFFNLSSRAQSLGRTDEGAFWFFYALFRLRYDLLRCGSPDSIDIMSKVRAFAGAKGQYADIESDSGKMAAVLQRVLDFDATHPANNNPRHICTAVNRMQQGNYRVVDKVNWPSIRHTLRQTTERGIEVMQAAKDDGKK